ncbi:MAG: tetratricopeptide repeat protein [Kiritimatiellae bacterium]|nr:tetratricopeptide repeat protein [Kiritimatiellia bacterium]
MTDPAPVPRAALWRLAAVGLVALALLGLLSVLLVARPKIVVPAALPGAGSEVETALAAAGDVLAEGTEPLPEGPGSTAEGGILFPAAEDPILAGEADFAETLAAFREGQDAMRRGDFAAAEPALLKVLARAPDNAAAARTLGTLYLQRGQFAHAAALFEQSFRSEPYNAETLVALSMLSLQVRDFDRSLELINLALRLYPGYGPAAIQRCLVLLAMEDPGAETAFREAIEAMPRVPSLRNNLAVLLIRRGEREEAREQLSQALALAPNDESAAFNYALSLFLDGNVEEGVAWLGKVLPRVSQARRNELLRDPDLAPYLGDPAVQAFLRTLDPAPEKPAEP